MWRLRPQIHSIRKFKVLWFLFSLLSQRGCVTYSCCWYTVFFFLSPEKLKDLTKRMNSSLNTGIFLFFSSSRPPKFDRNSAPRPVARTFPWHASGKQLFLCLPHESLFTGDLLTAKELLAQMKYFTNIEEKVKDRITEGCWGTIVIQLSEIFTLVLRRLCSRIFIVNGVYLLYYYWYLNKVHYFYLLAIFYWIHSKEHKVLRSVTVWLLCILQSNLKGFICMF